MSSLEKRIKHEGYPFDAPGYMRRAELPKYLSFMQAALALEPNERSSAAQLLQHDWLKI
jgi:serine/threonine-protein kinase SRPK3